jgi:hypothetical protein
MLNKNDLRALRNIIAEARTILNRTKLPEGRAERAVELLDSAVTLTDGLIAPTVAASLGRSDLHGEPEIIERAVRVAGRILDRAPDQSCFGGQPNRFGDDSGASPNPCSRSAETGNSGASTMHPAWASA